MDCKSPNYATQKNLNYLLCLSWWQNLKLPCKLLKVTITESENKKNRDPYWDQDRGRHLQVENNI